MEIKRYKIIWGYEELQETKATDCRNCEIVVKYSDIKHLLDQPKIDKLIEWAQKRKTDCIQKCGSADFIMVMDSVIDKAKEIRDEPPKEEE